MYILRNLECSCKVVSFVMAINNHLEGSEHGWPHKFQASVICSPHARRKTCHLPVVTLNHGNRYLAGTKFLSYRYLC